MLGRVILVRTDVSEELSASIISVTRIGELGTTLAVTSNRRTLRRNTRTSVGNSVSPLLVTASSPILVTLLMEALSSSETWFFTSATLHSHRRKNLKSCITLTG
jgi:hypothetical protein